MPGLDAGVATVYLLSGGMQPTDKSENGHFLISCVIEPFNKGGNFMDEMHELEISWAKGKITRREFIARLSALGLSTALSPAILSMSASASVPKKGWPT